MKKIILIAAVAIAAAACSKTFDTNLATEKAIGFSTWNETMTKAKSAFAVNDEFDVFGFKTPTSGPNAVVFNGVDVKKTATAWEYSPLRFWDQNTSSYTFFAAYPKDVVTGSAETGLFTASDLAFNGTAENLLVAQKKVVEKANYGSDVQLVFKHVASLVDIKAKKHTDIASAKLTINSLTLSNIKVSGSYAVTEYATAAVDADGVKVNDPKGTWTPAAGVNTATTPYVLSSAATLAAGDGTTTTTAAALISDLVVMPQALNPASDKPTINMNYTITTGTGTEEDSMTYDAVFTIDQFDTTDNESNTAEFITAWKQGIHYTYYITINADKITFTASIDDWKNIDGFHYIVK